MSVEKFNVLLKCLLPYTHLTVYPKYMGNGIQTTVKTNELSSVMNVCIHDFHNDIMTCILQIGESTIHRIFVAWVIFMEAILSCLNIKPDNGCLPYSMPETSKKTDNGLTDIIIAWAEFNQLFFENGLLSTRGEMKDVHHGWGPCQKSL